VSSKQTKLKFSLTSEPFIGYANSDETLKNGTANTRISSTGDFNKSKTL